MSNFIKKTKHPLTGKWEEAHWIDDYCGKHQYGVCFPSDDTCYREEDVAEKEIPTRNELAATLPHYHTGKEYTHKADFKNECPICGVVGISHIHPDGIRGDVLPPSAKPLNLTDKDVEELKGMVRKMQELQYGTHFYKDELIELCKELRASAYEEGKRTGIEDCIKLSEEIEAREPDGGTKEWMAFKALRNRLRDKLKE